MDDAVNMKDIVYFARYFNGQETLDEIQSLAADLYEDSMLDARDLSRLAMLLASSLEKAESVSLMGAEEAGEDLYEIRVSSAAPGDDGHVELTVSGANCPGISAFRFRIAVPEGFRVQQVLPGDVLEEGNFAYDPETGIVTYYQTEISALNGTLFTMELAAEDGAQYGTASLDYLPEDFFAAGTYEEVPVTVIPGSIEPPPFVRIQKVTADAEAVSVALETNLEGTANLAIAFYDGARMCQLWVREVTLESGTVRLGLPVPDEWDTCKVFLLDGSSAPLCACGQTRR